MRALDLDPARRQPTAAAFVDDLVSATTHGLGPGWLDGCTVPLHFPDEIRAAAGRGGRRSAAEPPAQQAYFPEALGPAGQAAKPVESAGPEEPTPPAETDGPTEPGAPGNDPDQGTSVVAGTGKAGRGGDGGPAFDAELDSPAGIAVGPDGSLFITDTGNHRVWWLDPDGAARIVAGAGTPAGGPAGRRLPTRTCQPVRTGSRGRPAPGRRRAGRDRVHSATRPALHHDHSRAMTELGRQVPFPRPNPGESSRPRRD
ncbi:hypothetical protein [Frankia tisae]|uniref:hypothetical protein n=1 Tax=Frankia tisae TaxID=2950104 RepID=UPI0021C23652|nr:hypothetical protein [Frankia tisae]